MPAAGDPRTHQIGEVASAVGLSLRTIRHYEEMGVVVPSGRSAGGFRLYTDHDIARLRLVKRMKPLDLTLEEIAEILELLDTAELGDAAVQERLELYAALAIERCERLRERLALATEITELLTRQTRRNTRDAQPPARTQPGAAT